MSTVEEPSTRSCSPEPSVSPTLAISACPTLDRSVSTSSSVSSRSRRSSSSRLSDGGLAARNRRGYVRPQQTIFADSARNRESVMSLGSIAHLQYYFARTGLLDGKGAQLAKSSSRKSSAAGGPGLSDSGEGDLSFMSSSADSYAMSDAGMVESPVDQEDDESAWDQELISRPPTVSTYNHKPVYVPPPPDMTMLRRELTEALDDALKVLTDVEKKPNGHDDGTTSPTAPVDHAENQGFYEIQGLHLLDVVTLAIRAAKNYYTAHEHAQKLYCIKSERQLRGELYQVLDVLKRMAARNFAGGIKQHERLGILSWILSINALLEAELGREKAEQEEREKWSWRTGAWEGKEREREELFIRSFMSSPKELPEWKVPSDGEELPTSFLKFFQSGLQLVHLHNDIVGKSKRQFEEIKVYHTDTAKPYRAADNLRYWIKAAKLRWEVKLDLDVLGVVYGTDPTAWGQFDSVLLKWCKGVREEITSEWQEQKKAWMRKTPTLRIDDGYPDEVPLELTAHPLAERAASNLSDCPDTPTL